MKTTSKMKMASNMKTTSELKTTSKLKITLIITYLVLIQGSISYGNIFPLNSKPIHL